MNVDVRRGRYVSTIFGRGLTEIDRYEIIPAHPFSRGSFPPEKDR